MRGRRRTIEEEAERMQMRNRRRLLSPRVAVTALIRALTAEWAYTHAHARDS